MDLKAFTAIHGQRSGLLRTKAGRVILPSLEDLAPDNMKVMLSDSDLDAIMAEVSRRRRRWVLGAVIRGSLFLGFLVWTFLLMPRAALHLWPFR
jgi:hypothetical protein